VLRFESILALHRSLLAASKKDTAYNAALQRCITASRSIINTLHKALKGFGAFDGSPGVNGYESTPLLWPSFTWAIWMSTFIIISAATEDQVPRDVAFRLSERSIEVLRHLALRGTSWPEACIVAIENLIARLNGATTRSSSVGPHNPSATTVPNPRSQHTQNSLAEYPGVSTSTNYRLYSQASRQNRAFGPPIPPLAPTSFQEPVPSAVYLSELAPTVDRSNGSLAPNMDFQDRISLANAHLGGAGNFLGIAQQSSDNPRPSDDIMQLFSGEDFASWTSNNISYSGGW
jgi:hypothetical protein